MRDYVILTDSCCDLTAEEIEDLGIAVLPMTYRVDGRMLHGTPDHADMAPKMFFEELAAGKDCATAAVNVGQYTDTMKALLDEGKDVLCICFSGGLSTTYQSACIAADDLREEYPDAKIVVIDSLSASRGQGLLVYLAAQKKKEKGVDIETLAEFVRGEIPHLCHWFIVDDLNHLKRGGRISAAAAMAGTMLNIKPILHFDNDGKITAVNKARGTKAAVKALVDRVEETGVKDSPLFICHADCPENAALLKQMLSERLGITDVRDALVGPVVACHSGCGTLGLFFVGTER